MNFKIGFCFILILSMSASAFADSYYKRPISSNYSSQGSSILRTNVNSSEDYNDYSLVINDLKKQIANNPNDYSLLVPLVDAYIKTGNYNEAFTKLTYINSLKNKKNLNSEIISSIEQIRNKTINKITYSKQKSPLYINIAIMSLITGNKSDAEKYIRQAAIDTVNHELFAKGLSLVFNSTKDYEQGLTCSSIYLSNNKVPSDVKTYVEKTRVTFLAHLDRYNDAITEQAEILKEDKSEETLYYTYKLLKSANQSEDKILKTLFGDNAKNKEQCYYDLYNLLIKNNNYEDAQNFALIIEKNYPNSVANAFLIAEKYANEGRVNQATEILDSISDKLTRNEDIAVYNRLTAAISSAPDKEAMTLFAQGYPDKALELLEGQNIPNTPDILAFKARCCMELGKMQKALEYLNRAISIDSNNILANIQFGNYYLVNGDYKTARQYADKALQIDKNNQFAKMLNDKLNEKDAYSYIKDIMSSYEAQNYDETMRLISKALKIAPNSAIIYYYQGLTYIAQNNYASSTASLYKSLELDKSNIDAYYYLGIAFDNLSEYENAYKYYKQFLRFLPYGSLGESEKEEYAENRIKKLQTLL